MTLIESILLVIGIAVIYYRNREEVEEYNNGKIAKRKIYRNRKLAHSISYYENGNIETIYIDRGKNFGKRFYFDEDGKFSCKEEDGGLCIYYRDGKLEEEGYRSSNGEKDNDWKHYHYDEDGRMDSKTIYDKGTIIEENFYNNEGEHTKYIYEDGLEKKGLKYDRDGELIEEIDFYDDKKIVTEFFGSDTVVTRYKGVTVGEGKTKMRSYLFIPDSVERHKKSKKDD